jgi:hypothetical protein
LRARLRNRTLSFLEYGRFVTAVYVNKDAFARVDAPPAPPELHALGRPFVDRAVLRYKGFRLDLERVASAVSRAGETGDLSPDARSQLWFDRDHALSGPLQERYLQARKFDLIDRYQRARLDFQTMDWPDPHARAALEGFARLGEGPRAAALALAHVERAMKSLRQDWRERGRGIPDRLPEDTQVALRAVQGLLIARIPLRNQAMLLEIATVSEWVEAWGTDAEQAALSALRAEVVADMERFPATPGQL